MIKSRGLSAPLRSCLWLGLCLGACTSTSDTRSTAAVEATATHAALRPLTTDEALADFDQMVASFRTVYGALERKEQRYGFDFEELAASYRARLAQTKSEPEAQAVGVEFIARFKDAHVGLATELTSDDAHELTLPFAVMPITDTYVVYHVDDPAQKADGADAVAAGWRSPRLERGDELLSIDAVPAGELAEGFLKYAGIPNTLAAKHLAAMLITSRPAYASAGLHAGDVANVRVRGANGRERELQIAWTEVPHLLPPVRMPAHDRALGNMDALAVAAVDVVHAELLAEGDTVPFFLTPEVREQFDVSAPIGPSAHALTQLGIADTSEAASKLVYAVTYSHHGARNLLLRVASYQLDSDEDAPGVLGYILALLVEQAPNVDGIVIDETHNPGGSGQLAQELVAVLSGKPGNGVVQRMHGDRRWLEAYTEAIEELVKDGSDDAIQLATQLRHDATIIDAAYSSGQALTEPLAYPGLPTTFTPPQVSWARKPLLVLTDELSASAAEVAALLIQANGVAPLFGQTTMGAGGNVEPVAYLSNSQAALSLSRGAFTVFDPSGEYPESRYVEDIGVTPDMAYAHTLEDFRAGYVGYVAAFSEALGAQNKHQPHRSDAR